MSNSANKIDSGMPGVLNSGLDPAELSHENLVKALGEADYLIGLFQKFLYSRYAYNQNDDSWGDITPNQYRQVMREANNVLEECIWDALHNAESKVQESFKILNKEYD